MVKLVTLQKKNYLFLCKDCCVCYSLLLSLETEYAEDNPKTVLQCGHIFHLACIYEWMERSAACPFCSKVSFISICILLTHICRLYLSFDVCFVIFTDNAFLGEWNYRAGGLTIRDILRFLAKNSFITNSFLIYVVTKFL